MIFSPSLLTKTELIVHFCVQNKLKIACAESCTGGLLATLFTAIPGVSAVFERGLVTYSLEAKQELLGVPWGTLERYTAVSAEVVSAMATGLLARAPVDFALATTGVAGPARDPAGNPVGHVFTAVACGSWVDVQEHFFQGEREEIRMQSVSAIINQLFLRQKDLSSGKHQYAR